MRRPLRTLALLGAVALAVAGCGGEPLGPSAGTLADGTAVPAQRYLADADEAAAAVTAFSDALETVGPVARADALQAASPMLEEALSRARVAGARLSAQRLDDSRLERQRAAVVPLLDAVIAAMDDLTSAAAAGRPVLAAQASERFAAAVEELRASRAPA